MTGGSGSGPEGLTEALGLKEALGLTLAEALCDGLTDALGLTDEEGEREAL